MIKIAICDDEQVCIDNIEELLEKYFPKEFSYSVKSYLSGEELLDDIQTNNADIIFMDIELSTAETGLTGLAVVQKLNELEYSPIVFFVTSHQNYIQEIFRLQSFQFLPKPIKDEDFKKDINRAVHHYVINHQLIEVKSNGTINQISICDIIYIEVNQKEIKLHTKSGVISHYGNIQSYENKLTGYSFAKSHKSFLVNLRYISKISYSCIRLDGVEEDIPLSRSYRASFLSQYNIYSMGISL